MNDIRFFAEKILLMLVVLAVLFLVVKVVGSISDTEGGIIKRAELIECQDWLKDKSEFTLFYATQWQVDQCNTFNINLEK